MPKYVLPLGLITCAVGFCQANLTGTWQLTTVSARRGVDLSATLVIAQVGIDLSGQITGGSPCIANATDSFTGSVLPAVSLLVNASNEKLTFSNGTVVQGQAAGVAYSQIVGGTYTARFSNERCNGFDGNGDSGTWTAKQLTAGPPPPPPPPPPSTGTGIKISRVSNAANGDSEGLVPGEVVSIYADTPSDPMGPAVGVSLQLDANGKVATSLAGVQVSVWPICNLQACPGPASLVAPLTYVSARQINAIIPYELAGATEVLLGVIYQDHGSNALKLKTTTAYPRIFTVNGSGAGQGAILNDNGFTLNGPDAPEPRGGIVTLYVTGEGQTVPSGVTGKVTTVSSTPPLTPVPQLAVSVSIDGQPASVAFAGEAPGLVSGVMQINVQVPANVRSGNVPIEVSVGTSTSPPAVTVAVK
jgi:uncharacterized protein (TIGR03437 family)